MNKKFNAIFVLSAAAALAVSAASYAQFSLPKIGGSAPSGGDALASQDQLVKTYAVADSETLLGQAKIAEALGLKDQAAQLSAEAQVLGSGGTLSSDDLKKADSVQNDAAPAIQQKLDANEAVSDEAKQTYAAGLGHLGLGLVATVKLKDSGAAFEKSAQAQISSASIIDKMSVTNKLAAGTYVASHLPGHISNVATGLKSATSFAQSHGIPVPTDATAALQ